MTDRAKVYTKVKKTLKQMLKLDHQGQVVTSAMMISGIAMSRKAQLSTMSSEVPSQTKDQSIEMRMMRWVKDDLEVEAMYMAKFWKPCPHLPLVLAAPLGYHSDRLGKLVCSHLQVYPTIFKTLSKKHSFLYGREKEACIPCKARHTKSPTVNHPWNFNCIKE